MISKNKELMATAKKFAHLRLSPPTLAILASEAALINSNTYLKKVKRNINCEKKH